jgi:hypothetical protein
LSDETTGNIHDASAKFGSSTGVVIVTLRLPEVKVFG